MTFDALLKYACRCMARACLLAFWVLLFLGILGLIGGMIAPVIGLLWEARP